MADRDEKILICDGLIQPTLYSLDSAACEGCTTRNPPGMPLSDDGRLREVHFRPWSEIVRYLKVIGYRQVFQIRSSSRLSGPVFRVFYSDGGSSDSPAAAAFQLVGQGRQTRNVVSAYQLELLR